MADNPMVIHDGQVIEISGTAVKVKILSQSACSQCHAKNMCNASEQQEKIIDAVALNPMSVGDTVIIKMAQEMGWKAVLYGFFLPFCLLITVLFSLSGLGMNETRAAVLALVSLTPYYIGLVVFKSKIEKNFVFYAEKKNKI